MLRKDATFKWEKEQEDSFLKLKKCLTTSPVIVGYRTSAEHQKALLQKEEEEWKPIAFYSRSTTKEEKNYHSYELETLAVVESLERFKYYVYGKQITVITDCSAIETTMKKKELIPRIARWWLRS